MYYLYDGLGSVIAVTDDLGQVVATYEYDVFGKIRNETGSANNNLKYIGEQYDEETGFIYLRARYYDPSIGRFITKDTFAGFGTNPQSLNRYAYAYNNPINLIDPSGHSPLEGTGGTWLDGLNKTIIIVNISPKPLTMEEGAKIRNKYMDFFSEPNTQQAFKNTFFVVVNVKAHFMIGVIMSKLEISTGDRDLDKAIKSLDRVTWSVSPGKWNQVLNTYKWIKSFLK